MKHVYYRALPAIGKIAILVSMGMFPFFAYSQAVTQPAHWHSHSQETATNGDDSLAGFDANPFLQTALSKRLDARETALYLERAKRNYINAKYNLGRASSTTANPAARFGNPPSAAMAPCTNMDFETGNFTGWSGFKGENTLSSAGPLQNIQAGFFSTGINASITDMNARHTIVQNPGAGNDVCGGFPCVAPGGSYSVRLGNDYANYQGEAIEQTFTVGATNTSFTYNYAVVLNDGGHSQGEQPYFRIEMYDSLGNPIPCAQYFVEAGGSIPGFISCGLSTYYKP
ncbi:MAG TPA: hypothetical protein VI731_00175, partial [Bacteroidia bacterium]|nr:hypothetical protein [Bacteroidia bacterium]